MAGKTLASMTIREMKLEIQRRQAGVAKLEKKRKKILGQLAAVDKQIAGITGGGGAKRGRKPGRRPGGKRPVNKVNLSDSIAGVLKKDKPSKIAVVVKAVLKSGYKSNSKNFRLIVTQTLVKDKRFKSAGRGLYVLAK